MGTESELLRRIQAALVETDLETEELVDGAWQAARTEVAAVLQRAFQQELLDRVAHVLEDAPTRRTDPLASPADPSARGPQASEAAAEPPAAHRAAADRPAPGPSAAPTSEPTGASSPRAAEAASSRDTADVSEGGRTATYVFGITRTTAILDMPPAPLPGTGAVRAVDHGELRAVVCDVPAEGLRMFENLGADDLDHLATAAEGHEKVLTRVAAQEPVLPLRFGTLLPDDSTVRALLTANGDVLARELERVEGHAEWAVVVHVNNGAPNDSRGPADPAGGADYLQARREELTAREDRWVARERLATEVHERLAGFAVEARTVDERPLEQTAPALHGVYLLRWDRIEPFEGAVDELRAAHPEATIEASGPWPPYHFTSVDLTLGHERAS